MTKNEMATKTPSSSSKVSSNSKSSITNNNGGSDGSNLPNLPITAHKLNGHNYLLWSQFVMMFVSKKKGKNDYLIEVAMSPNKEDPKFKTGRQRIIW